MAPDDFFFFPKLKLKLRGTRFQSIEDIKENSRRELKSIPENAFKNVLMIGLFVGISELAQKEPILKAIIKICIKIHKTVFLTSPGQI